MFSDVAVIIPSRLRSARLNNKPLQLIGNMTMIEHVYRKVAKLNISNLYVATDAEEIANVITKIGGKVITIKEDCASGTDRVYKALDHIPNNDKIRYVINVQGDLPFIDHNIIYDVITRLKQSLADIATPVSKINYDIACNHSNVKVVIDKNDEALYFSRNIIPYNAPYYWYHIGIYGFTKAAITKFVGLPESFLEKTEGLEQLRALENGMQIAVCYADSIPISVDTTQDLENARAIYRDLDNSSSS